MITPADRKDSSACPVCRSPETSPVLQAKDYTVSGEVFTINQCSQCNLRFTYPVPDLNNIGAYYKSEDYISHTDTHKGLINKLYHAVRTFALLQKKKLVVRATGLTQANILDIGCGTGAFLNTMKEAGWQVTGLEPDEQARLIAQQNHKIEPFPADYLFRLPAESFQAITMWHVLEHVHPLHEYMKQINQLLIRGGRLFIAIPNYTSWDANHYQTYWAAYDVPRHLYHFSPQSLVRLAEQHQFRVRRKIVMPFDAFYICLLSEKYQKGKTHYINGFLNGLRSWTYAKKHKLQGSSMIYILDKE